MSNAASRVAQAYSRMHSRPVTGVPEHVINGRLYLFIDMDNDEATLWAAVAGIRDIIAFIEEKVDAERMKAWETVYAEQRVKLAKAAKTNPKLCKREELKIKRAAQVECELIFKKQQRKIAQETESLYDQITYLKERYNQRRAL